MDLNHYQGSSYALKRLNKLLITVIVGLLVITIALSFCLYRAIGYKTYVLVPPVLTQQASVSEVAPDDSYLRQMGLFAALLRFNVSPSNAFRNFRELKSMLSAKNYGAIASSIDSEQKFIEQRRASSVFFPISQRVDAHDITNLKVSVTGYLQKYVGQRPISKRLTTFVIIFNYRNGKLSILNFYTLKKES